jgi:hypothetical protein
MDQAAGSSQPLLLLVLVATGWLRRPELASAAPSTSASPLAHTGGRVPAFRTLQR